MELAKGELSVVEDASVRANEAAVNELTLLQLAAIGGGGGDVFVG
ncbi:hypothetical protein [Usitatibacter rugosus]|nr:hypothetical protein [Usitatibacter rugosus]